MARRSTFSRPNSALSRRSRSAHSGPGRILRFEPLEPRRVLATFTVTNLNDATVTGPGNAPGTLRQAIFDANAASDSDVINFASGLSGELRLSIADDTAIGLSALVITSPITIQGNPAGITLTRNVNAPEMRFFRVAIGGSLTLDSINVANGITRGTNGAPGQNGGSAFGGAIYNQANLQIISSTLYNNSTVGGNAGGGGNSGGSQGGAIFNDGGNVTIRNSTFSGNSASNGFGTTVARSYGGAIYGKNGSVTLNNSTVTNNSAFAGRDIYVIGLGAGQTATAQINSSIIAHADVTPTVFDVLFTDDLGGQVVVTGANNLIRSQDLFFSITVSSDDPLLGALTQNGGPTLTHALLAGSPAIGHGSNPVNLASDQRGGTYSRVVGGTVDIGAYELQTVATPAVPGDYTGNQRVDAADYILWRKTKGADVPQYTGADGNGSSKIDDGDYDVWRAHFGTSGSGSATGEGPELSLPPLESGAVEQSGAAKDLALDEMFTEILHASTLRSARHIRVGLLDELAIEPIDLATCDLALLAMTSTPHRAAASTSASHSDGESDSDPSACIDDSLLPLVEPMLDA